MLLGNDKFGFGSSPSVDYFIAIAKATVRKPGVNGQTICQQVGNHLADNLAEELASMLHSVMPAFIVKSIGEDVLQGADAIAEFIYGNTDDRRKVYHLAQTSKIPIFRMGSLVCARKSTLLRWIADQEARVTNGPRSGSNVV